MPTPLSRCHRPLRTPRSRAPFDPRRRGFTLIESLVAMALLAVVSALALPSLRGFVQRRQLDGASAQLQADLQQLRSASVARNLALRFTVSNTPQGSCYLVHSGEVAQCSCSYGPATEPQARCSAGAELLRAQAWAASGAAGVNGLALRANVASMRVDPRHGTVSPTGSIDLQAGDGPVLRHVVNILGRVRLCTPSAAIQGVAAC